MDRAPLHERGHRRGRRFIFGRMKSPADKPEAQFIYDNICLERTFHESNMFRIRRFEF